MDIRQLEVADEQAFLAFNALLLAEKVSNPFIETAEITDFKAHQVKLRRQEREATAPDRSTVTTYFAFVNGEIAGKVSCRWELDKGDLATVGGHIGYVTSPNFRRQGVMTKLLTFALNRYRERGITRVFITARADNLPSCRTIEAVGGQLQDVIELEGGHRLARYWVLLDAFGKKASREV